MLATRFNSAYTARMGSRSSRRHSSRRHQVGAPPGSLSYVGTTGAVPIQMRMFSYDANRHTETVMTDLATVLPHWRGPEVTWIDIDGLSNLDVIRQCGDLFTLHPLVLEDILHTDQRPKLEDHGDYLYIVTRMLRYDDTTHAIASEQLSVVLSAHGVITFQEVPGDVLEPIRDRIRQNKGRIRAMGPDYLAYALLDALVDQYFIILEQFSNRFEQLEDAVLIEATARENVNTIHHMRQELVRLRRAVWPLRDVLSQLERSGSVLLCEPTRPYWRDLYDHTVRVIEGLETDRDLLAGLQELSLSNASFKLNEVMKVLTIISTIFIPLTFVVGVYGMNFDVMPELRWHYSYPTVMIGMGLLAFAMVRAFRRKGWF